MDQEIVVSYGGGVNSVAMLVHLKNLNAIPRAIVMADPGSEKRATELYRDSVLPLWLKRYEFPPVTVINRIEEGGWNKRAWRLETLEGECARTKSLPSVAYGWKKCSAKYKGDTQRWWAKRQTWMQEEWRQNRKVRKAIGYDADEERRVKKAFQNEWESARFEPWYPLVEANFTREDCEDLIKAEGLPVPPKSACTFCPNNTLAEWETLKREEPARFAKAVEMSRRAAPTITSPDVVGLMRCNPHGKRQLHIWADGGYEGDMGDWEDPLPCECAL